MQPKRSAENVVAQLYDYNYNLAYELQSPLLNRQEKVLLHTCNAIKFVQNLRQSCSPRVLGRFVNLLVTSKTPP